MLSNYLPVRSWGHECVGVWELADLKACEHEAAALETKNNSQSNWDWSTPEVPESRGRVIEKHVVKYVIFCGLSAMILLYMFT